LDCDGNVQTDTIPANSGVAICACVGTIVTIGGGPEIIDEGPCEPPVCECRSYTVVNNSNENSATITWRDCDGNIQSDVLSPFNSIAFCACIGSVFTFSFDVEINDLGPCETPTCTCYEYTVTNMSMVTSMQLFYTDCDGNNLGFILSPGQGQSFCACVGTVVTIGGDPDIIEYGICSSPIVITPSSTPTPTPTPTCAPLSWAINTCSATCLTQICNCAFDDTIIVYTNCNVTNLTNSQTLIYTDSGLTIPYVGFFNRSGSIWYSNSGVTLECELGGPC
jgi:hypothetical protein